MHESAIPCQASLGSDKDGQKSNGMQNEGRRSRPSFAARSRKLEMVQKRITPKLVEDGCDERKGEYTDGDGYDSVKISAYADGVHKNRWVGDDRCYIEECYRQKNSGNLEFVQAAESV